MRVLTRILPHPILTIACLLAWLLLQNSASPGHIVLGLGIGIVVPLLTDRFWPGRWRGKPPIAVLGLVAIVIWDIIVANVAVARLILFKPTGEMRPIFVDLPLASDDEYVITLLASIITMTPGTLSADLDRERGVLVVHSLDDGADPEGLIARIKNRYERRLVEIFR